MKESITIDIHNDPDLMEIIVESVPYMSGWKLAGNIKANYKNPTGVWKEYPNNTPRFIRIYPGSRTIIWGKQDHQGDANDFLIRTPSQLSRLLERVYEISIGTYRSK